MEELPPSKLGTKDYWDKSYDTELANFAHNGDEGEVWFGEDSLYKMLSWIDDHSDQIPKSASILDLGCGNGVTCMHLAAEGYTNVTGLDYSKGAIDLSQKIAEKRGHSQLTFEVADLLHPESSQCLKKKYDLVLDKGTYDAISLMEEAKVGRAKYLDVVFDMIQDGGFFLITSCNWTEDELEKFFTQKFEVVNVLANPKFRFGGKEGSIVAAVAFRKPKVT